MKVILLLIMTIYSLSGDCAKTDASIKEAADCTCVGASCTKDQACQTNLAAKFCLDATSFEPTVLAGTLKAWTTASDPTCADIASSDIKCRHATSGIIVTNGMKTSATDALCVTAADKCANATTGIAEANTTTQAKTSSSNDTCLTVTANDSKCISSGIVIDNKYKTAVDNFACITVINAAKCANATTGVQEDNTLLKAITSSTNFTCVTLVKGDKDCRDATTGIKVTENAIKKSATDFECLTADMTDKTKCRDATSGLSSANTLLVARTSSTDATCVTLVKGDKDCRGTSDGVKVTVNAIKSSATEFLCDDTNMALKTKCRDATSGLASDNTLLVARTSSTDATCVTLVKGDKDCRGTSDGVKVTVNAIKTSATEFLCLDADMADKTKCRDATSGLSSANTGLIARTSSTDATCVTLVAKSKDCTDSNGVKAVGIKESVSSDKAACQANWGICSTYVGAPECVKKDASAKSLVAKCKCGSAECVTDEYCATDACVKDCASVDGTTKATVKCQCGTKTCVVNEKCKSADNTCTAGNGLLLGLFAVIALLY